MTFLKDDLPERLMAPRIRLDSMRGHKGQCKFCVDSRGHPGIVKMSRDNITMKLQPDKCRCLLCGQAYFMRIDDLKTWENEQWKQKQEF